MRFFFLVLFFFSSFVVSVSQRVYSCKQDLFPVRHPEKKLFGYVDLFGNWKVRPYYDHANYFSEGLAVVKKRSRFGVIDCEGKVLLRVEYDEIKDFVNGFSWVRKDSLWGLVDYKGKIILKPKYTRVEDISKFSDYAWLQTEGKWGVFNKEKVTFVHTPQFSSYQLLNDKTSLVEVAGKRGMIKHADSTFVLPAEYESINKFAPYLLEIVKDGKIGVLSDYGRKILSPNYDEVYDLNEGRFSVKLNSKQALLTNRGKKLSGFNADSITPFIAGRSLMYLDDSCKFINSSGKQLYSRYYQDGALYKNGEAIVKTNDAFHLLFSKGVLSKKSFGSLIQWRGYYIGSIHSELSGENHETVFLFNQLDTLSDLILHKEVYLDGHPKQVIVRTEEGKCRFFNVITQRYINGSEYDKISEWNESGYASVELKNKIGIISKDLIEVVPPVYAEATMLDYDGRILFRVKKESMDGYRLLNEVGDVIIKDEFDKISYAGKNKFIVQDTKTKFSKLVNHRGKVLLGTELFKLEYNPGSKAYIGINAKGKRLLINESGEVLSKKFTGVVYLGNDRYSAWKKAHETVLNGKGEIVIAKSLLNYVSCNSHYGYVVTFQDKYALVGKKGELITKYNYDQVFPFCGKFAVAKKGSNYGIITVKGKEIVDFTYSGIKITDKKYFLYSDKQRVTLSLAGELE